MRTVCYLGVSYTVSDAHPATDALPWHLDTDEFANIVESMRTHGFDPDRAVVRCGRTGRVIGGRRRELACRVAAVEPVYRDVVWSDEEVIEWVRRDDLQRRSLMGIERVMAELSLNGVRHRLAGVGANQHTGRNPQVGGTPVPPVVTAGEIAERAGVSRKTVQRVKKAAQHPSLLQAIRSGRVTVALAAKLADMVADVVENILAADDLAAEAAAALTFDQHRKRLELLESNHVLLDAALLQMLTPAELTRAQALPRSIRALIAVQEEPKPLEEYESWWQEQLDLLRRRAPEVEEARAAGVLDADAALLAGSLSPAHRAVVLAACHPPTALRELVERKFSGQKPITAIDDWDDHSGPAINMDTVAALIPEKVWAGRSWVAFQHLPATTLMAEVHACHPSVGRPGREWFVSLTDARFMFGSSRPMKAEFVAIVLHNWGFDLRAARWHPTDDPPAKINPLTR